MTTWAMFELVNCDLPAFTLQLNPVGHVGFPGVTPQRKGFPVSVIVNGTPIEHKLSKVRGFLPKMITTTLG